VKERLQHQSGVVRISADPDYQILSDQKTYGLWGLYTVASRNSGFLDPADERLTGEARAFVEREYLPRLDHDGSAVFPFLEQDRDFEPSGKDRKLAGQLAGLLSPEVSASERDVYAHHLLAVYGTGELQQAAWEIIREVNRKKPFSTDEPFSMPELREMIKTCKTRGHEALAERLENIRAAELVFAPAAILFNFLQDRDQQKVPAIAREVRSAWKQALGKIDPEAFSKALAAVELLAEEMKHRLIGLAEAMKAADYDRTIRLLLEQNSEVMRERGGSPWILLREGELLDVHYRENTAGLDDPAVIPDLWINTYFINSLKRIGFQIHGGAE